MSEEEKKREQPAEEEVKEQEPAPAAAEGEKQKDNAGDGAEGKEKETERKVVFSLCYLWGILFFLPLILYKNDEEAKFRANEGLVLLIVSIIGNAVFGILTAIGGAVATVFGIITGVFNLGILILAIIGIINVINGDKKELPLFGKYKLIR